MEREILQTILYCIILHMVGYHILQYYYMIYIKSNNWINIIIHCILYVSPFILQFGIYECLWYFLFIPHIIIDICRYKFDVMDTFTDHLLHSMCLVAYGACMWCYI